MNDKRLIFIIEPILASIAWIEAFNEYLRFASGIIALIIGTIGIAYWWQKVKEKAIDNKIKEQQYLRMQRDYLDKFGQMPEKKEEEK